MRKRYFQAHRKLYILCAVIALCVIVLELYTTHEEEHRLLADTMGQHVQAINDNVTFTMEEAYALQALVIGAEGGEPDMAEIGPELYRSDIAPFIRGMALAPGGVITQVYPTEGNESLLGVDLYEDGRLRTDAPAATAEDLRPEDTNIVFTHIHELPGGGGHVIAGHLRVFLSRDDGTRYEWGVVSVFSSFPEVLAPMGNGILERDGYAYRIITTVDLPGIPEDDSATVLMDGGFAGGSHSITEHFTVATVPLALEAYPVGGWLSAEKVIFTVVTAFVGVALVAAVMEIIMAQVRRLRLDATEDALTGLLNRAAAKQRIERILRSKDFSRGAFLLMDVDHFKEVNDLLGHQCGDEVLVESAHLCLRLFREGDVVCRMGGDEFLIFLSFPGEPTFLEQKVERLLSVMRRSMIGASGEIVSVSASIGVASTPEQGSTFDELYHCADIALYHAKRNGRDSAVYYREALETPPSEAPSDAGAE